MRFVMIGGGVVGQTYAEALQTRGHALVAIWDDRPTEGLRTFVRTHGSRLHAAAGDWLADADVVFSAVFGTAALEVATRALGFMRRGSRYVDMTTADPDDMVRAEALAAPAGVHFVDVAITGAVNLQGRRTPLLAAGREAEPVAALFRSLDAPVQVVGDRPGDAASLKLLRSVFTKGLEALSVECLMTAEKRGLRHKLHDILADIDQGSLRTVMESMVLTHITHASRRQKEVAEARRQMRLTGIEPAVLPGVESVFERTAAQQLASPFTGNGIEAALDWLSRSAAIRPRSPVT